MTDKKQVMVEIAASFQQSFDSIFATADERIAKLKGRIAELGSTSRDVKGLQELQNETKKLETHIGELTAKIPGLSSSHESAKSAVEAHTRKVVELSEAERQQQALLAGTALEMTKVKSAISSAEAAQAKRSVELKNAQSQEQSLDAQIAKVTSSLEKLSSASQKSSTQSSANSAAITKNSATADELAAKLDRLTNAKTVVAAKARNLGHEIDAESIAIAEQRANLSQLGVEHVQLGQAHQKAKQALSSQVAVLKSANKDLGIHADLLAEAQDDLSSTTTAFNAQTLSIQKNDAALKAAGHDTRDFTKLQNDLAAAMARTKRTQDLTAKGKRQADRGRELRGDILGGAFEVAGMAATLGAPIKLAAEFEHSMAKVGAQTMASAEEMKILETEARKLGDTTIFSSSEAASAQSFLAQAGFSVMEIKDSLKGVLDLAAAGDTGLAETAEMASNMLAGFSLDATEMGRVANAMTATFISSNTDLRDLAETMKYAAPVASGLGASLEEVAAASGLLGNIGVAGSMAGTALRAMYQRLASPPAAGREALERLGIATKDAKKNLLPMPEILENLNKKLAKMGTADRAKYIKDIFGEEAAASATELIGKAGTGQLEFEIKKLQLAPAFRDSLKHIQDNMTSDDLKGLQSRFGIAFKEGAKGANIAEFSKAFAGLKGKDFDKRFDEIFKIKPTIDKTELDLASKEAQAKLKSLNISQLGADKQQKSNDQLTKEIEAALKALPEPKRLEAISTLFAKTRSGMKALMQEATQGGQKFQGLTDALEKTNSAEEISSRLNETTVGAWKTLQSALEAAGISAGAVFLPALSSVMKVIADGMLQVSAFATSHESLVKWVGYLAAGLMLSKGVVLAYKGALWTLNGAMQIITVAQKAWNLLVIENPIALVAIAVGALAYAIYKNWDSIVAFAMVKWEQLKVIFKEIWKVIGPVAKFTPLGAIIENWEPIVEFFANLFQKMKPIFQSIISFFDLAAFYKAFDAIGNYFKVKWDEIKNIFKAYWKVVEPIAQFTPLGSIIKNWDPIVGFFSRLLERLKPIFRAIGTFLGFDSADSIPFPSMVMRVVPEPPRIPDISATRFQPSSLNKEQTYNITQRFDIAVNGGEEAPVKIADKIKSRMTEGFKPANFSFADSLGF